MLIAYGWFCRDGISKSGKLGRLSQKHRSFNGSACFVEISLQCSIWMQRSRSAIDDACRQFPFISIIISIWTSCPNPAQIRFPSWSYSWTPLMACFQTRRCAQQLRKETKSTELRVHFDWARESLVHGCDCSDIEKSFRKSTGNHDKLASWLWNILEWVISVLWLALVHTFPRIQLTLTQYTHFKPPGHTASEKPQARNTNQPQYLKFQNKVIPAAFDVSQSQSWISNHFQHVFNSKDVTHHHWGCFMDLLLGESQTLHPSHI